ncbi:MAG: zinc-ribbon domain-containing protein [Candidatus Odinarchaeota archaeon]
MHQNKIICRIFLIILACSFAFTFESPSSYQNSPISPLVSSLPLDDTSTSITYGYDIVHKIEQVVYYNDIDVNMDTIQSFIPPNLNTYEENFPIDNPSVSYVFPPDERVRITTTSIYPWSSICKIEVTAADDTQWVGSGAIINAFHVLTCGHLVYLHDNGGWASQIKVIPGMRGNYEPFGYAYATYMRTYQQWIQTEDENHDWALITLDRTIGDQTGWMGRMTKDPLDPIYTGTLHIAGYPVDLESGRYMYYSTDVGEDADMYNHWYWMDTYAGNSGSPVWVEVNGSNYILTVHAYEYEFGAYANFGTRLNQNKFDQLYTWLAQDTLPTYIPNGLDPNFATIIIIIAVVGLAVLVLVIIIMSRKARPKLETIPSYDYDTSSYYSQSAPLITPQFYTQPIGNCPKCGKEIYRDGTHFCSKCGYDLSNEPMSTGNGGGP